MCSFFFFQAEDGIRDGHVTGVQTCALPICPWSICGGSGRRRCRTTLWSWRASSRRARAYLQVVRRSCLCTPMGPCQTRSEERRVGEEWRSGATEGQAKTKGEKEVGAG